MIPAKILCRGEGVSALKHEKYHIFFDSPTGLVPGSLDLCQTAAGFSGHITLMGRGTNITDGTMEGDLRNFGGTIWYKQEEVPFHASGMLSDGVLDIDMSIGSQIFPLTGFPIE